MNFEYPWAFLLLILPAVFVVLIWQRSKALFPHSKPHSISYSSLSSASAAGKSWRHALIWLPGILVMSSVLLLIVAVARPQYGVETVSSQRSGVAIEMLFDISSSMDIHIESSEGSLDRIAAAKKVCTEFILGNDDDLLGRQNDIVGLVTFARYADTACPMTTGLPALATIVNELEVESRPNEDGTAFGDALILAAARLMKLDDVIESRGGNDGAIKSKIIILLTDGDNNCGKHLPSQAAALAQEWGIKIYAIFLGDRPRSSGNKDPQLTMSQKELVNICQRTGGICRMVYDYDSLNAVYAEIDQLEKSELNLFTDLVYRECFDLFVLGALLCLALSILLNATVMRRTP